VRVPLLASCQSLHTLDIGRTGVSDVSALAKCQSLHSLDFSHTQVRDVTALAACLSLRELIWYAMAGVNAPTAYEALPNIVEGRLKIVEGDEETRFNW
jgi:Leucine-rich repeat (LRR) protein